MTGDVRLNCPDYIYNECDTYSNTGLHTSDIGIQIPEGANIKVSMIASTDFNGWVDRISCKKLSITQNVEDLHVGKELVLNPSFTGNATNWTLNAGWTYNFDNLLCTSSSATAEATMDAFTETIPYRNKFYLLSCDVTVSAGSGNSLEISYGGVVQTAVVTTGANSIKLVYISGTNAQLIIRPLSTELTFTLDNVSVKHITDAPTEGNELIVNGSFQGNINGWVAHNWEFEPNHALFSGSTAYDNWVYQTIATGEVADSTVLYRFKVFVGDTSTNNGTLPVYDTSSLSSIARIEQGLSAPRFVVGGRGGSGGTSYALYKKGSTYTFNLFRSQVFHVGTFFRVTEISIPLSGSIDTDMEITPVVYFDNGLVSSTGTVINSTNYPDGDMLIVMNGDNFNNGLRGTNNFYIEFQFTGGTLISVAMPVTITVETDSGAKETFSISSIFDGFMPSALFGSQGQYLLGLGIDPDLPVTDSASDVKTGGLIRPVAYEVFSGAEVNASPIAILTNPKNNLVYVVLSSGKIVSYDSNLGTETAVGNVQESSSNVEARGAFYYNNYIYVITPHDVSRLGPLNGSPTITNGIWTGSTLGSQDALIDTDYPVSLFSLGYLNHFGTTHVDGRAYFLDYADGVGLVHQIHTMKGTVEGDTDDSLIPSAYGILDLPFNYIPVSISSYGNDLVVSASYTTDATINQGKAALFFFNPADTTPSFYRVVSLPDVLCSGLKYDNGVLYGLSGDLAGGYRLFRYVGGDSIETLKIIEDGVPPLQAAVDFAGNRLVWAGNTTTPVITSGLYAYGSKSDLFPRGLHHIAITTFS